MDQLEQELTRYSVTGGFRMVTWKFHVHTVLWHVVSSKEPHDPDHDDDEDDDDDGGGWFAQVSITGCIP